MTPTMMLTTIDNPFSPFDDWDRWFQFDEEKGYHTCNLIARMCVDSDDMADVEQQEAYDNAVDDILDVNINPYNGAIGMYTLVMRDDIRYKKQ